VRDRHPPLAGARRRPIAARLLLRSLLALAIPLLSLAILPASAGAADGLTMDGHAMLGGHARVGSWMAITIHVKNDGPSVSGELRLTGGSQSRTRFGLVADLPNGSDKTFLLYAQPPSFGQSLEVSLVDGDTTIAKTKVAFTIHDLTQLVVGVVAEKPGGIVGNINLLPNQNQVAPQIVPLELADLPERVEAWGGLDRLVWQDADSSRLTDGQLQALQGWVAGGGRLVIVGGTAGPNTLTAFPDTLLPYRPTATVDVPASALAGLIGAIPPNTPDVPALGGTMIEGRVLLTSGDRVIAAERSRGNGSVTIVGVDPSAKWLAGGSGAENLWRRVLPARSASGLVLFDDSQLVGAVSQLPSLALPPIGGLILLLVAYILLIGPINYLVLRRLDRREWAWVTMPVLIVAFAVGAYGFGAALRGSDVLVNEVALVRGSPGATDGTAQVYVGVFSPSRGSYQVSVPGGALLSSPINGEFFGGDSTAGTLDVLQGDPAKVRDLAVGFGSLRTIRAETPVTVPMLTADLSIVDGRLKGTLTNGSQTTLEKPAVVLGGTVAVLTDLLPGTTQKVDVALVPGQFGQPLSDKVVGPMSFGDPSQFDTASSNQYIRHTIVDQLTFDPNFGSTGQLSTDSAVILAWGSGSLLPVEIAGQAPRATGNVLYYLPTHVTVRGKTTFRGDLLSSTIIDTDSPFFGKDPMSISIGRGQATVSYKPIAFDGTLTPTELTFGLMMGGDQSSLFGDPKSIEPLDKIPEACPDPPTANCVQAGFDGMPEVELFDLAKGDWVRLPHLTAGTRYSIPQPARYVDAGAGTVLARFVNDRSDGIGFQFDLSITGDVR
jgi:hypothetical protein